MIRQQSFTEDKPTLYLVPTPIGNLQEMTPRALDVLKQVDCIAAEDTRNTYKLLATYGISKSMISHHEHNQNISIPQIVQRLEKGKSVAVVSDAGYPLISDPGANLVQKVIHLGYPVVSVSGANAATNALVASGLSCQHYLFYGFLDSKSSKRKKELKTLETFPFTLVFYEAPHRIEAMLKDAYEVLGDRKMVLARELTKIHEEYIRGTIGEIIKIAGTCKGEMVVVIEGYQKEDVLDWESIVAEAMDLTKTLRVKEASKIISDKYGCSKNKLYQEIIKRNEHAN